MGSHRARELQIMMYTVQTNPPRKCFEFNLEVNYSLDYYSPSLDMEGLSIIRLHMISQFNEEAIENIDFFF
jgi:hypothetical protein